MNKRITSLLLCFVMVLTMLATAVPALAAGPVKISMTADKAEASPGETITYTVTLGEVSRFDSMRFELSIPAGLTFVTGSGKLADNLRETLDCVDTAWTESTKIFYITLCSEGTGYTSSTPTELMKFQCKVDEGATGSLKIEFIMEPNDCYDSDYENFDVTKETPNITVVAAPKPATGITLNKSAITLDEGSFETLIATVTPSDTTDSVSWTSSNEAVATVDGTGKVTAVTRGTATITVKAGEKTASCVVTVACAHAHASNVPAEDSTCTVKGWDAYDKCDDCGAILTADGKIPYLALALHNYSDEVKKADALKTAGTCKDDAVYYYSCAVCGAVENNDAHTFLGDKDAANHTGGTYKLNQKEATCKEEGYTGDTYCTGCNVKLADGTDIGKSAHNPAGVWSHNETKHWKECTNVVGCGVKLNEADHSSTGANVATCQHKAVCDVCGTPYGELAAHDYATVWSHDDTNHWHACTVCGLQKDVTAHVFDQEVASDAFIATAATCTEKATYFKSCVCGAKGTETFAYGTALGHTEGSEWQSDADNHWHICSVAGCGTVIESSKAAHSATGTNVATCQHKAVCDVCGAEFGEYTAHDPATVLTGDATGHWYACRTAGCTERFGFAAHTPDRDEATETEAVTCSDCGYVITPALGHTHSLSKVDAVPATCTENGTIEHYKCEGCGKLFADDSASEELTADRIVTAATGHDYEWKIDKEATATEAGSKHKECKNCGDSKPAVEIPATGEPEDPVDPIDPVDPADPADPVDPADPEEPAKPEKPDTPQTGDSSHMILWVTLLLVSGGAVVGATVYSRKKKA